MPEIDNVITSRQRKLIVSDKEIMLHVNPTNNMIFILMVEEAPGSAGGRAAGSGSRRIDRIYGFSFTDKRCDEFFQTTNPEVIDKFEIPYSAVAMDIKLSDGRPFVVQGVIDPELIKSYSKVVDDSGKTE